MTIAGLSLRTWLVVLVYQGLAVAIILIHYGKNSLWQASDSWSVASSVAMVTFGQCSIIAAFVKTRLRDARPLDGRNLFLSALLYIFLSALVLGLAAWLWTIPRNGVILGCWGLALGLQGTNWIASLSLPISRWGACLTADPPDADRGRALIILYVSVVYGGLLLLSSLTSIPVAQVYPPGYTVSLNPVILPMFLLLFRMIQWHFPLAPTWKSDAAVWGILVSLTVVNEVAYRTLVDVKLPDMLFDLGFFTTAGAVVLVALRYFKVTSPDDKTPNQTVEQSLPEKGELS